MKNFVLIGAAGYVAPRHMRAIRDTGNRILVALDKSDSVGIIDSFFPEASFFTEFERFDRHVDKLVRKTDVDIDYVSVCSPNYLHDAHIRFGLRIGADVICEKPLVLNPWNVRALQEMEAVSGRRVFSILQLRLHSVLQDLKRRVDSSSDGKIYDVDLTYITSRGNWYYTSWKGKKEMSGGIATNIGIHLFDMLNWIFGEIRQNVVHIHTHDRAAGYLELDKARVRWFLSINPDTLPAEAVAAGARTYRSITVDGQDVEFSEGFNDLHTLSYQAILDGKGFGLDVAARAVQATYEIRNKRPVGLEGEYHPLAELPVAPHPFEFDEHSNPISVL